MKTYLIAAVIIGAAIGMIAAVVKAMLQKKNNTDTTDKRSFPYLIKNQVFFSDYNMDELTQWFLSNTPANKEVVYFLAKPTKRTAEMFALSGLPANIDTNTNLIQAVVTKDSLEVLSVRLICFTALPVQLSDMFKGRDYVIINQ